MDMMIPDTLPSLPRETLNLRIKAQDRGLIDRAAGITGKTRTDFVIEAARRAAEEALLDRTLLLVSQEAFDSFAARLDLPPKPNDNLLRTLKSTFPWE